MDLNRKVALVKSKMFMSVAEAKQWNVTAGEHIVPLGHWVYGMVGHFKPVII